MEDSPQEVKEPEKGSDEEKYVVAIYPLGLIPGMTITSEQVRKAKEAQENYEKEKNDKKNKPPKPPRGRGIRIGRIAIAEGI